MELFANRVWATLASGMDEVQTSLYLSTGHGARFGTIGAGDKIRIVLLDSSKNVSEVMYATARVGDTLTVSRAQDGTVAAVHLAGDRLEHRIGKSTMDSLTQKAKAGTDAIAEMHAATSKATPVDADEFAAADSVATFGLIRFTWANIKATLVTTWKDTTGGFVGMTLFKINFKNAANTFTSFLTNANTAARTYTFQNRDGTIADDTDLASKANVNSPTFTGTVGGITKSMVGLGNVDNTADSTKSVNYASSAGSAGSAGSATTALAPAAGIAAGTLYEAISGASEASSIASIPPGSEVYNARIKQSGTYRIRHTTDANAYYSQVFKNGVAFGTLRNGTPSTNFTEDLAFNAGDTVQIFTSIYSGSTPSGITYAAVGASTWPLANPEQLPLGDR